jgi:hypothetical protein
MEKEKFENCGVDTDGDFLDLKQSRLEDHLTGAAVLVDHHFTWGKGVKFLFPSSF